MNLKVISTGSKGNAYILQNESEALLLECGVAIKDIKIALNFNFSKVVGCLLTHEHQDHSRSIKELMHSGIGVYSSKGTFESLNVVSHRANQIEPKQIYDLGGFRVMAFDVDHDASQPFGYLIYHQECGNVLFLTDTMYSKYKFPGLNNIIIEANYSKSIIDKKYGAESEMFFLRNRILKSHMSLENCIRLLKANNIDESNVNKIVLIHLSDSNSHAEDFKKEVMKATGKNVFVAENNMEIEFNKL